MGVKARVLKYALAHLQGQESLMKHFQNTWVLQTGLGPVVKTTEGEEVQVACSTAKGGQPTQTQKMKKKVKKADTPKVELDRSRFQTRHATSPVCCPAPERLPVTTMKPPKTTAPGSIQLPLWQPSPTAAAAGSTQSRYYPPPAITTLLYTGPKVMDDGTKVASRQVPQQSIQRSSTSSTCGNLSFFSGSESDVSDRETECQPHELRSRQQRFHHPLHRLEPMFIFVDVSFYADDYTQHYNDAQHQVVFSF